MGNKDIAALAATHKAKTREADYVRLGGSLSARFEELLDELFPEKVDGTIDYDNCKWDAAEELLQELIEFDSDFDPDSDDSAPSEEPSKPSWIDKFWTKKPNTSPSA